MEINKEDFKTITERVFNKLEVVDEKINRLINKDAYPSNIVISKFTRKF